jgi:amino acid transporter
MALKRELSSVQATALNMIDMVGIGPFITTSIVALTMGSAPLAILAWICGAALSFADACIWSELGAKMPEAGGTYAFVREAYGRNTWGRLMAFLFVWQTVFQAPLVVTSGALGFAKYFSFLDITDAAYERFVAALVVIVITFLLYRKIGDIGKISVVLWSTVILTLIWIIVGGLYSGTWHLALGSLNPSPGTWHLALGTASISTMYSYLGYYNICHLGAEVKNPQRVIPRSMIISIAGITVLYLLMQVSIFSVLPADSVAASNFVISEFMTAIYGSTAAQVATGLILIVALSSLFSVMLGYTRIPYAAAKDGLFFKVFSHEHPKHSFPHISLLVLAGLGVLFSLTMSIEDTIKSIIAMRVFTQFISQAVGLVILRRRIGSAHMPWRMWLYPIPVVLAVAGWIWIFASAKPLQQQLGLLAPVVGVCVFLVISYRRKTWPFSLH